MLAAQPASAQTGRSSATNSVATSRTAPTAVPTATARAAAQVTTCRPQYEVDSGGVPYTGVCERTWEGGKYECRHFARDFCDAVAKNGSNQAMGSGCWIVGTNASNDEVTMECSVKECGVGAGRFASAVTLQSKGLSQLAGYICSEKQRDCFANYLAGHAQNIFRSGGKEFLDRYGEVTFSYVEPQYSDGRTAVLCSWTQTTLEPKIPDWCKEEALREHYPKQVECGVKYNFELLSLEEIKKVAAEQDKSNKYNQP